MYIIKFLALFYHNCFYTSFCNINTYRRTTHEIFFFQNYKYFRKSICIH